MKQMPGLLSAFFSRMREKVPGGRMRALSR